MDYALSKINLPCERPRCHRAMLIQSPNMCSNAFPLSFPFSL